MSPKDIKDESLEELMRQADDLIASARRALKSAEAGEVDVFLQHAASYLGDFEPWSSQISELKPFSPNSKVPKKQQEAAKAKVKSLYDVHTAVVQAAEQRKEVVGGQLGSMHKKSKAIKTYLDPYPSRVSITGKRKG